MKTLSEDITLTLPTTNMQQGYVNTLIYHNDAEIFAGRTYIPGNNSSIYVNINDFVILNHGKNDRLKLNDAGKLVSTPLDNGSEVPKKWEDGQVGNYKVSIYQDTSQYGIVSYSASTNAVCGYDYINENLKPTIIDNDGKSELGRLLQGTNWYVDNQGSRGVFDNKLLPHVPSKPTKKFGIGLQVYTNYYNHPDREYALRTAYGKEYNLGPADCLNGSNQTFVTLSDLYLAEIGTLGEDTSLFLKYQGTSGDEFGDWQEGRNWYKGTVHLDSITVLGYKDGVATDLGTHTEGATFNAYIRKYILATRADWNLEKIIAGNRDLYSTDWTTLANVTTLTNEYMAQYKEEKLPRSAQQEFQYDYITGTPHFSVTRDEKQDPSEYLGKCTIAVLDSCYSRYYLAWMDRYGDYMSQPFEGKYEYSEDFEKSEMKDYKLKRRIIHNELQPKWKLNSTWINEEIYPIYEAIFTSPYLLLYDTKTDRAWNVILSDNSYLEKTFKNLKKLFNLEINVEANTKENRIF